MLQVNCCETVTITSTDPDFLESGYKIFAGTYTKYADSPSANGRLVYKLQCKRKPITTSHLLFFLQYSITVCTSQTAINGLLILVLILGPVPII